MVHQLKLQNVTDYSADADSDSGNTGYKFYGITAQNQDTGATSELHLNNDRYVYDAENVGSGEIEASRTFDCKFYSVDKDTNLNKEIFHIEGLKIDGAVEYDAESHTVTAAVEEAQNFGIEFSNSESYTNSINSLMNDHSNQLIG